MQFWLGIWYTLIWVGVLALCGVPFAILYLVAQRRRMAYVEAPLVTDTPSSVSPVTWSEPARPARPQHTALPAEESTPLPPMHPQQLTSAERRHTLLVGSEGDGKTQAQIAVLVGDIARGDQVIWASTNLSLYHSRDQQTDLRPLVRHFEQTRDALEIMAVLQWASAEVDRRMPFYHADRPHGHPIVIHIDELGGLYRTFGDTLVAAMRNIAEQGRKVDVFLFLVAHSALKESTGLDAALKPLFKTRLLGNVDQFTWTALVGPGNKLRGVPDGNGLWHQPDKRGNVFEIQIRRPSANDIAQSAARRSYGYPSILAAAQPYLARLRGAEAPAAASTYTDDAHLPARLSQLWQPTALHVQVRELVEAALPDIIRMVTQEGLSLAKAQELTQTSYRALARRLGLGGNGGSAAVKVSDAIKDWEQKGGVRLFDVPTACPQEAILERVERSEHLVRTA